MTAYNYDTQRWETGNAAAKMRAEQLRQELATLESARGSEYLKLLGMTETLPAAIEKTRALIAECEAVG